MKYLEEAQSDAQDAVETFADEIVEHLVDNGQVRIHPLNDLHKFDEYHHESHVDKEYHLSDAASLLDELAEFEETDDGLWEGLEPRRAISAQAAYTYGNAVLSLVDDLLKEIQDDETITNLLEAIDNLEEDNEDGSPNSAYECTKEHVMKTLKERVEQIARGEV